ncbi:MAG: 50S ribosomal protein L30 [Magnetococcales bacterium]|nr:50S ribosomal protein L30 [Magnetococcales bacterium]
MSATVKVKLTRSVIGHPQPQKDTVRRLGLTKMQQVRELPDNAAVRGMIAKVHHLVTIL